MKKQYMKPGLMVEFIQINAIMNNISTPTGTNVTGLGVDNNAADEDEEGRVKQVVDDFDEDFEDLDPANGWNGGLW